jgi:hypothetical protein
MFKSMSERLECERRVLSSLLLEGKAAFDRLPALFDTDCFEDRDHRAIFEAIRSLAKEESEIDLVHAAKRLPKAVGLIVEITSSAVVLKDHLTEEAEKLFSHNLAPEAGTILDSPDILTFKDGKELVELSKTLPPIKDLVKHILRQKSLNFLAGESGCGKSIFAMNLALSVAVGAKTFLAWEIEHQGKVLYLNHELYLEDFAGRFDTMSQRLPAPGNISNVFSPMHIGYLSDCWKQLNEFIAKEKPCLIIVDCLYFAHNQDESDNSAMKDLVKMLISLRDNYDTCVLVVHHTKKGVQSSLLHNDQMRGAGVFAAASDTVLMIKRSQAIDGVRIVKATKLRHAADEELRTRAISLGEFLWFTDIGMTTEEEHMAPSIESSQPNWRNPNTTHAQVLRALLGLRGSVQNGLLSNSMITDVYNAGRFGIERLSAKKIIGILRELGFQVTKGQAGGVAIFWNENLLEQQCRDFGIPYSPAPSEPSESSESSESSYLPNKNNQGPEKSEVSEDSDVNDDCPGHTPTPEREKEDSEESDGSEDSDNTSNLIYTVEPPLRAWEKMGYRVEGEVDIEDFVRWIRDHRNLLNPEKLQASNSFETVLIGIQNEYFFRSRLLWGQQPPDPDTGKKVLEQIIEMYCAPPFLASPEPAETSSIPEKEIADSADPEGSRNVNRSKLEENIKCLLRVNEAEKKSDPDPNNKPNTQQP